MRDRCGVNGMFVTTSSTSSAMARASKPNRNRTTVLAATTANTNSNSTQPPLTAVPPFEMAVVNATPIDRREPRLPCDQTQHDEEQRDDERADEPLVHELGPRVEDVGRRGQHRHRRAERRRQRGVERLRRPGVHHLGDQDERAEEQPISTSRPTRGSRTCPEKNRVQPRRLSGQNRRAYGSSAR